MWNIVRWNNVEQEAKLSQTRICLAEPRQKKKQKANMCGAETKKLRSWNQKNMMKETFPKSTYSERYKIHSVPFYRGFVKTITAAHPHAIRGIKRGQYSSGTSTLRNTGQILGWYDPRRIKTTKTLQRYLGRSPATNIKNPRCRRTSSATSEYTKNIYIYTVGTHTA